LPCFLAEPSFVGATAGFRAAGSIAGDEGGRAVFLSFFVKSVCDG
jgi:hypothetical protein